MNIEIINAVFFVIGISCGIGIGFLIFAELGWINMNKAKKKEK